MRTVEWEVWSKDYQGSCKAMLVRTVDRPWYGAVNDKVLDWVHTLRSVRMKRMRVRWRKDDRPRPI